VIDRKEVGIIVKLISIGGFDGDISRENASLNAGMILK
jgi:hypothetical protein